MYLCGNIFPCLIKFCEKEYTYTFSSSTRHSISISYQSLDISLFCGIFIWNLEYSELLIMAVRKRVIFFLPTSGECIIYTLAAVEMWFPALVRGDTIPPFHHCCIANG